MKLLPHVTKAVHTWGLLVPATTATAVLEGALPSTGAGGPRGTRLLQRGLGILRNLEKLNSVRCCARNRGLGKQDQLP